MPEAVKATPQYSPLPFSEDNNRAAAKTNAHAQPIKDSIDNDRKASPTSPSKLSQIFSSFWQWMTTPVAGGVVEPVQESGKIEAVGNTTALREPRRANPMDIDRAYNELLDSYQVLQTINEMAPSGTIEKLLFEQHRKQIDSYDEAVQQGRERFLARQSLRKLEEKEYQKVKGEYDKINKDGAWYQTLYNWGLAASALGASAAAAYAFGTSPAWLEGTSNAIKSGIAWGIGLFSGVSAINGVAQANQSYKVKIKEGELSLLKVLHQITDLKLRDNLESIANNCAKYAHHFKQEKEVLDMQRETSQFINGAQN